MLLGASVGPSTALELTHNGDFELPLGAGDWQASLSGSTAAIDRASGYDPDPDYEVNLTQGTNTGYARLDQIIDIPGPATLLTFAARVQVSATAGAWAAAGLAVGYLDARGLTLAETRICASTRDCPWEDSPVLHLISIGGEEWQNQALDIAEDLTHFPGLDPERIRRVRVSLLAQAYNC
jgi:hypothetical protein